MGLAVRVRAGLNATFGTVARAVVSATVPMVGAIPTVMFCVLTELVPQVLVAVTEIARLPVVVPALVTVRVVLSLPSSVILAGVVHV